MTSSQDIQDRISGTTVPSGFVEMVSRQGGAVALRWKNDDDTWSELTYADYADQVARVAAGFSSLGLSPGDRIMLMMNNVHEFHVADMAALMVGATPISIYNSSAADQIKYVTDRSKATMALVEDDTFLARFRNVDNFETLQHIGVVHPPEDAADVGDIAFTWDDLLANEPADLHEMSKTAKPDDLATVIFTSGTTGPSKGVMLTHNNIVWTVDCMREMVGWDDSEWVGGRVVSYLPMAHIAERMFSYYMPSFLAAEITCCPKPGDFAAYAAEVRPNLMFGVPRVWEKIYSAVNAAISADPEKKKMFDEAYEAAAPIRKAMTLGTDTQEQQDTYDFLDQMGFEPIRAMVGLDQVKMGVTGAAPIPQEMLDWFRTIGVPLSEIYGLSETSGPMTWDPWRVKAGSVGREIPGCEVRLADEDQEVICRGGNVFAGYLDEPEKTAEVLDDDGWFHSGDIGTIDDEGYVCIVDRKKELIVTAGGKNISPANLEANLKMIPLIGQAAAIGDRRPFVSALVVLDPDAAPGFAAANDIEYSDMEELAKHPEVVKAVEAGLVDAMAEFNHAEKVKKVTILGAEWQPDSALLTPTSKLKRRGVHETFEAEIEAMYS